MQALPGAGSKSRSRTVLHVDCDEFFLQVHERSDARIAREVHGRACAVVQYHDVICANRAAKEAGVRKHQRPDEARALLAPVDGRLVHAFWVCWPGQRVQYLRYQQASRALFDAMEDFLQRNAKSEDGEAVLERTSIDECFIDCSHLCSRERALELAHELKEHLQETLATRVSIGVSNNKLLAKLASTAVKRDQNPRCHRVRHVCEDASAEFLEGQPASKLPGCGGKAALAGYNIADLQRFEEPELCRRFSLSETQGKEIFLLCRGIDSRPVSPANPPKSLVVSSWLAGSKLSDLARKTRTNRESGVPIVVGAGKWLFEPHHLGDQKTNSTRGRWILLGLVLDLADRIRLCRDSFHLVPTTLSVAVGNVSGDFSWKPQGKAAGSSVSRSLKLPPQLVELLGKREETGEASLAGQRAAGGDTVPSRRGQGIAEDDVRLLDGTQIDPQHTLVQPDAQVQAALGGQPPSAHQCASLLRAKIGGLIDAIATAHRKEASDHISTDASSQAAGLLQKIDRDMAVGQLTLTVAGFTAAGPSAIREWCRASPCARVSPPYSRHNVSPPAGRGSKEAEGKEAEERRSITGQGEGEGEGDKGRPGSGCESCVASGGDHASQVGPTNSQGGTRAGDQEQTPPVKHDSLQRGNAMGLADDVWRCLPAAMQDELEGDKWALREQERLLVQCRQAKDRKRQAPQARLEFFFPRQKIARANSPQD